MGESLTIRRKLMEFCVCKVSVHGHEAQHFRRKLASQ